MRARGVPGRCGACAAALLLAALLAADAAAGPAAGAGKNALVAGDRHYAAGRNRLAVASYRKHIKEAAGGGQVEEAWYKLGLTYQVQREHRLAVTAFQVLGKEFPAGTYRGLALEALGDSYRALGEWEKALESYASAAARQPGEREKLSYRSGLALLEAGKHRQAIQALEALAREFPEGEFRQKVEMAVWKAHYLSDPSSETGKKYLAYLAEVRKKAKAAFKEAQKDYYSLSVRAAQQGRLEGPHKDVVKKLDRVVQEYPDSGWDLRARYLTAAVYAKCGLDAEAGRRCEAAAEKARGMSAGQLALVVMPTRGRLLREAAEHYSRDEGHGGDAARCLRKIIDEMRPESHHVVKAYEQLAEMHREAGRYGQAAALYREMKEKGYWQKRTDPDLALLIRAMESRAELAGRGPVFARPEEEAEEKAWLKQFVPDELLPGEDDLLPMEDAPPPGGERE